MSDEPQKPTEEAVIEPVDKSEEYLNNWKRERADFLNYKKDEAKRIEEFVRFANEDLVLEMLETLDDLELAVKELKGVGLEPIIKKFKDLFKKYGVEEIEVAGQKFNPEFHEVVATLQESEPRPDGREMEPGGEKMLPVRTGYTMHGKVIRPARVQIKK
jgi:molecular chaperone GrpE